ncbi:hypothetical protein EDC04DRAFT_1704412 [Pisolithus marmoratus]|nr:hypothetical protein EDC04DRAFT_1704412 [Pisolithus marmoratus]
MSRTLLGEFSSTLCRAFVLEFLVVQCCLVSIPGVLVAFRRSLCVRFVASKFTFEVGGTFSPLQARHLEAHYNVARARQVARLIARALSHLIPPRSTHCVSLSICTSEHTSVNSPLIAMPALFSFRSTVDFPLDLFRGLPGSNLTADLAHSPTCSCDSFDSFDSTPVHSTSSGDFTGTSG